MNASNTSQTKAFQGIFLAGACLLAAAVGNAQTLGSYTNAVIGDNPVAYLRMTETNGPTAYDSTTNGNNGAYYLDTTVDSGALTTMLGPGLAANNTAVVFSGAVATGTDSAGSSTSILEVTPPTLDTNYSMECWIYPTLPFSSRIIDAYFISRGTATGYDTVGISGSLVNQYGLPAEEGVLFFVADGGVYPGVTQLSLNTWYYVALVRSGTTVNLYLNGQWEAGGTAAVGYTGNEIVAGVRSDYDFPFQGGMDSLAVYNYALSPTQIQNHWNAVPAGIVPAITTQPQGGTYFAGEGETLSVTATGTTLQYQWTFDTANIPGATASSLVFAPLALTNAGTYQVVVANFLGSVTSAPAVLNVLPQQNLSAYTNAVMGDNPVAFLQMTETNGPTAYDSSGNGNNGAYYLDTTVDSGALTNMAGPNLASNNTAVVFSGAVATGTDSAGPATSILEVTPPTLGNNYSMECWIYPTLPFSSRIIDGYFLSRGTLSTGTTNYECVGLSGSLLGDYGLPAQEGVLFFVADGNVYDGVTQLSLNTWYYVALVRSNTTVNLYLNGQLEASATVAAVFAGNEIVAGVRSDYAFPFQGGMDSLAVYNYPLTAAQVHNHWMAVPPTSAPAITTQPQGGDYLVGQTETLSVTATGLAVDYQWEVNSNVIPGATFSSLVFAPLALTNAGTYQVVVSNSLGSVTSAPAVMNVVTPVTVLFYQDEFSGAAAALNGRMPDTVDQIAGTWIASPYWNVDGNGEAAVQAIGGQNAFLPFVPAQGYIYTLSASMDDPSSGISWICMGYTAYAYTATFFPYLGAVGWQAVMPDGGPYQDNYFPGPGAAGQGLENYYPTGMANYAVILDTTPAASSNWTFTWEINGAVMAGPLAVGGSGPVINYVALGNNLDAGVVQNFTLTVEGAPSAPSITTPPQGGTCFVGESLTLSAVTSGFPYPTYQWEWNSNTIAGATASSLTLSNLALTNAGSYQLILSNAVGVATSAPAVVLVSNAPTGLNLSSNLVLHLKFDNDYLDYSGRGNNATSVGSSIVPGIIGAGAMTYGNNGSYDDLGYATLGTNTPPDLLFGHSVNFTLSYWIQYPNVPDNQTDANYPPYAFPACDLPIIGNSIGSTYQPGWVFAQGGDPCENNPGGFVWTFQDLNGNTVAAQGPAHSEDDGNWHSLVHVIDWGRGFGTTYLDGNQVDATSIASINASIDFPNLAINIGENPQDNYFSSPGAAYLDDLCVWRRALSAVEARSIYAAGVSNHVSVASLPQPVTAAVSSGQLTLTWSAGILQSAGSPIGPWTAVPGATPPSYTTPATASQQYYRVVQ
jgi:hypothetical protein